MLSNLSSALSALAFVRKLASGLGIFSPIASVLGPLFGGLAQLATKLVEAFFKGLAVILGNPSTIVVLMVALGYGYFKGLQAATHTKPPKGAQQLHLLTKSNKVKYESGVPRPFGVQR